MNPAAQEFVQPRAGASVGPYRLIREIGSGSSSVVFLAEVERDPVDSPAAPPPHRVALKILRPQRLAAPDAVDRFWRAAALAERAAGPNLCPIEGTGTHEGLPYLVLRFLDGITLAEWIQHPDGRPTQAPQQRIDQLLRQFEKLARALHHLHARGITHRDCKPDNILIDASGEPWLLDFGLMFDAADATTLHLAGSPAYLAPELLGGHGTPGIASDLYALGVTLFEAATGKLPLRGTSAVELLGEALAERRPSARQLDRNLPTDLDVVLDRLLRSRPEDRYADGAAVAEDLRRVRERLPLAIRRDPWLARFRRWLRHNPLPAAALAALAITTPGSALLLHEYRNGLGMADLLASRSVLAAAEHSADALLPARVEDLPRIRAWLAEHDGPDGLTARLARLTAAIAGRGPAAAPGVEDGTARADAEAELRAFEQIPRWLDALGSQPHVVAAIPALGPAIERQRRALEQRLDRPAPTRSSAAPEATSVAEHLTQIAAQLAQADGPGGVLPRMRRELAALEREAAAGRDHAAAWANACRAIETSAAYAADVATGFRLAPRPDLVPLGADPASGLQEFALLRSGDVPRRDAAGRLGIAPGDAIVFVLIPGGTFAMGASGRDGEPNGDWQAWPEESPVMDVTLSPFLLAKFELTQAQWQRLGGATTAILRSGDRVGTTTISELHPAEGMTYRDAELVLRRNRLALPTEAQWEHAARRGGVRTPFRQHANLRHDDDGYPMTHAPIGRYPADANGLHDLHGNVAEMVADPYGNYDLGVPRTGDGLRLGWRPERIHRGGGFFSDSPEARPSSRSIVPDFGLLPFVGVRPTVLLPRR